MPRSSPNINDGYYKHEGHVGRDDPLKLKIAAMKYYAAGWRAMEEHRVVTNPTNQNPNKRFRVTECLWESLQALQTALSGKSLNPFKPHTRETSSSRNSANESEIIPTFTQHIFDPTSHD